MVPGPGLEPGYSASKADVLPIRRSRNCIEKFSRQVSIRPSDSAKLGAAQGGLNKLGPAAMRAHTDSAKLKNLLQRHAEACSSFGEVAERFKAHAWKACVG